MVSFFLGFFGYTSDSFKIVNFVFQKQLTRIIKTAMYTVTELVLFV